MQLLSKVRPEHRVGKGWRAWSIRMKNQMFGCFKAQLFLTQSLVYTCLFGIAEQAAPPLHTFFLTVIRAHGNHREKKRKKKPSK